MKASESKEFNAEFPENFNWRLVDSISLGYLAIDICIKIQDDLQTNMRGLVPGLRAALVLIADRAKL